MNKCTDCEWRQGRRVIMESECCDFEISKKSGEPIKYNAFNGLPILDDSDKIGDYVDYLNRKINETGECPYFEKYKPSRI